MVSRRGCDKFVAIVCSLRKHNHEDKDPMLLNALLENANAVRLQHKKISAIMIFTAMYFLCIPKSKDKILTDEALHERMTQIDKVCLDKGVCFYTEGESEVFSLNNLSPNLTILIYGKKAEQKLFERLALSLQKAKVITKNVKIVLSDNEKQPPQNIQYFCTIRLGFNSTCYTLVSPFRSWQPNSDLFFLSKEYFPAKMSYKFDFTYNYPNNVNSLCISLTDSIQDTMKFMLFMRALHNLHSHSLGSYFYVPFRDYHVSMLHLTPFVAINIMHSAFSSLCHERQRFNVKLICALLYLFSPLFLFLFIFDNHAVNAACMFFFTFVNFRHGVLYVILVFAKNLIHFLLE